MSINWLSIIIAALVLLAVGFVWYNEKVFGKAWMQATGIKKEDAQKANMAKIFGVSIVMYLFLAWFLLYNVDGPGQEGPYDSFQHGAYHGFLLAMMVALPVLVVNSLFEMRSWKYILINFGYWLVSMVLMAGVIDAMNHMTDDMWPKG